MNTALVIIDVQWTYAAARHPLLLYNVDKQIQLAIKQKLPIFIVNYHGDGPSVESVTQAIVDYPKYQELWKSDDDGYSILEPYLTELDIDAVRMVGVHTDCCVLETTQSLHKNKFQPVLIAEGCNTVTTDFQCWDLFYNDFEIEGNIDDGFKFSNYGEVSYLRKFQSDVSLDWIRFGWPILNFKG